MKNYPSGLAALYFLLAIICYITLFCIAATAALGDSSLSTLKGISWALDTPDHKFMSIFGLGVACPFFAFASGLLWNARPKEN